MKMKAKGRYQWAPGPTPRVSADIFGEVVEGLAGDEPPTAVPPQRIVDEARKSSSPIHRLFNWDDRAAAEAHRRAQARGYLGRLEVVIVEIRGKRSMSTRAFFSVVYNDERGYLPRNKILSDRDLKLQVIAQARAELENYVAKYLGVLSFGNFIPNLQRVIDDMRGTIAKLSAVATRKREPAE